MTPLGRGNSWNYLELPQGFPHRPPWDSSEAAPALEEPPSVKTQLLTLDKPLFHLDFGFI